MFINIEGLSKLQKIKFMDYILEVIDKTEREIRLTKEHFKHIIYHKGMENYIEEIKETLRNPLKIVPHETGDLHDYYNYYKDRKEKAKYLQVVVKYLNNHGFILTAYFVKHI